MVSDSIQTKIVEMLEENGNRMAIDAAAEELNERVGAITFNADVAEERIRETIEERDEIVKDRFGGKDRVEKAVY